jgi:hypothetical protein
VVTRRYAWVALALDAMLTVQGLPEPIRVRDPVRCDWVQERVREGKHPGIPAGSATSCAPAPPRDQCREYIANGPDEPAACRGKPR